MTIYHGDCREIVPKLGKFDLLLTDPPYGVVNRESGGLRVFDKGGADDLTGPELSAPMSCDVLSAYVWCGSEQISGLRSGFIGRGFTTRLCFWQKTNPSPMNGQYMWLSAVEACVYARRSGAVFNEFCKPPVWLGPSCATTGHPTEKPVWLFKRLVAASTNIGGSVLDPFMGSGTTPRAAKDLGRKAIGIEIEERYCEIAAKRMQQEVLDL